MGGIGVQRVVKIIKYLVPLGYDITVLTVPENSTRFKKDQSMFKDLPSDVKVLRPFFYDYKRIIPGEIAKLFKPFERRYLFPDRFRMWNYFCLKKIKELTQADKYDLVFINCPPFSGVELAGEIKNRFDLKVFLNLRDPFSFNNYYILKNSFAKKTKASIIESDAFNKVDGIVTVTPSHFKKYCELYPQISAKFSIVTNGFDKDDFDIVSPEKNETEFFKIGYSGSFSSLVPLEPLLEAIYELNTDNGTKIKFSISTNQSESKVASLHKKCYDSGYIEYLGFLPHKKSISNLSSSHLLAMAFADSPSTEGSYPGKVFEYIKVGKPILLLNNHTSEISRLIKETKTGSCVNINNRNEIIEKLLALYREWTEKNSLNYEPDLAMIENYDYGNIVIKLDKIFNSGVKNEN
jgi:glycosyltransferase involved in cell wall biosynthesis